MSRAKRLERLICRWLFIFFVLLFNRMIAKRMYLCPNYFNETCELIEMLFDNSFVWKCRMINLINSYYDE